MDTDRIIESYVRDVGACLPRARRDDVAFELHALLHEELAERAAAAGRPPDRAMALALLAGFGRPAEVAQRYHPRAPLVAAADTPHFLLWAVGGMVVLAMHAALGHPDLAVGELSLQWLGLLLVGFAAAGWLRRRQPAAFAWKPHHGPEWAPRWLSALSALLLVVFPLAMYLAPVEFTRVLFHAAVPVDGLALDPAFAGSGLRMITAVLLAGLVADQVIALLLGQRPAWLRRAGIALSLGLGLLLVAHASPLHGPAGQAASGVFASAGANAVAAPIFLAVGGMMLLFALYYGWREWALVRPAPAAPAATAS